MGRRLRLSLSVWSGIAAALTATSVWAQMPPPPPPGIPQTVRYAERGPLPKQSTPILNSRLPLRQRLTPVASGAGLLAGDPVNRGASPEALAFGTGAARWLFLAVGGHGELGKTVGWDDVQVGREMLGKKGTRLGSADAPALLGLLGATHVLLSEVSGDATRCNLTLRLCQGATFVPVGKPVALTGTPAEVTLKLPEAAAELARGLKITSPRIAKLVESASDLQFIGTQDWEPLKQLPPRQRIQLFDLANRSLLAALTYSHLQRNAPFTDAHRSKTAESDLVVWAGQLERAGPDNAISMHAAYAIRMGIQARPGDQDESLPKLLARFPNNGLLNRAEGSASFLNLQYNRADECYQRAVRCNPGNALYWYRLASILGDHGAAIRGARVAGNVSREEWERLAEVYEAWVTAARIPVALAPTIPLYWTQLSNAALFSGDSALARRAIAKAIQLHPADVGNHLWALEMREPKWGGSPDDWRKQLSAAMAAPITRDEDRVRLALYVRASDEALAKKLLHNDEQRRLFNKTLEESYIHFRLLEEKPEQNVELAHLPIRLVCHAGIVRVMAVSPNGDRIATAGSERAIYVHSLAKEPELLMTLPGHTLSIRALAWSPDGAMLASAGDDKSVRVWKLNSRGEPRVFKGHDVSVASLAWSPDSKELISIDNDGLSVIWNVESGQKAEAFNDEDLSRQVGFYRIRSIATSPDGKLYVTPLIKPVTATQPGFALWDAAKRKLVRLFGPPQPGVLLMQWSPDSRYVAYSTPNAVEIWDPAAGLKVLDLREFEGNPLGMGWIGASYLAVGDSKGVIQVFDLEKQVTVKRLEQHRERVTGIHWDASNRRLVSSSWDYFVFIWDRLNLKPDEWLRPGNGPLTVAATKPLREVLRAGVKEGRLTLSHEGTPILERPDGAIEEHNREGAAGRTIRPAEGAVNQTLACAGTVLTVVSGGLESRSRDTGKLLASTKVRMGGPLAISPDGTLAVVGDVQNPAKLLTTADLAEKWTAPSEGFTTAAAFSTDGKKVAIATGMVFDCGIVRVLDVATGAVEHIFEEHVDLVRAMQFSPDGRFLASVSQDGNLIWRDLGTGKVLRTLFAGRYGLSVLAVLPSQRAITGGFDKSLRLWDLKEGKPLGRVADLDQMPVQLVSDGDGKSLTVLINTPGVGANVIRVDLE